jgi:two-component system, sensor histidine kinase
MLAMRLVGSPEFLLRSSRGPPVAGIILIVITIVVAGLTVWELREDAIANYRRDMTNLGVVLAEQTSRSMQAVDLVLQETQAKILADGVETPEQLKRLLGTIEVHRFLGDRLKNLPQADGIFLIDADGRAVNGSRTWPILLKKSVLGVA